MNKCRYVVAFLAVMLMLPMLSHAQLALDLKMVDSGNYIVHEPIYVRVLMRNDSGRPLAFGEGKQLQGKLNFEVTKNGQLVPFRGAERPELPPMVLNNGQTSDEHFVVLNQFFQIDGPGRYRVHYWISHPQMPKAYQSNYVSFQVSDGVEVWRLPVGEPELLDPNKPIKTMYYTLHAVNKGQRRMFYIRIEDDQKVLVLRPIGQEVGSEKIDKDVDGFSNLHLIVPLDPKLYVYLIMDLHGNIEKSEIYKKDRYAPRLGRDEKRGMVFISGGEKAVPGIDFKEPEPTKADGTK